MIDALAPTNFPWSNPTVLRESVDNGGLNFVRGARQLVKDVSRPPRLPASVDTSKFEVGGNIAATPGAVVIRNEVFELIQYAPQTSRCASCRCSSSRRLSTSTTSSTSRLVAASIEYRPAGQQVFVISWRNPTGAHAHFDLDTYVEAIADARDAVAEITGQERVHAAAACSGGIIAAGLLGHLAATGRLPEFASLSLLVCVLDNARGGTTAAMTSRDVAAAAVAASKRKGYLDGLRAGRDVRLAADPTTWFGPTSSTTTCSASRRRRSTSCTGTRTPCGSPPACTATSSRSRCENPVDASGRARGPWHPGRPQADGPRRLRRRRPR